MEIKVTKVLITGATGFIGSRLLQFLNQQSFFVNCIGRTKPEIDCQFFSSELTSNTDFTSALAGCDVVIHVAARAHVMFDTLAESVAQYRETNTLMTLALAKQAAQMGVQRFIFLSSIKVNGEQTPPDFSFSHDDKPNPLDPYGISKTEAEYALFELIKTTDMQVVIIRPPLVYGSGVKGNFSSLINLAAKNLPLPFGAINNKRSMVALDNLVDLIVTCIDHPAAANQIFLVSDDHDLSTTELIKLLTKSAGKNSRLLPVPVRWLEVIGKITGKQAIIDRLCGNLQVDISHTKTTLGWKPPITVEEGIRRCFTDV